MDNYFIPLNNINVNGKTEKKNGLTYLSWVWAWGEIKKLHPDATYKIYENAEGWFYHTDGRTCWVKTGVTINGIEHIEYLPVMNNRNKSLPIDEVTSFAVNTAIQRSLTKAIARHGLGLYIYAGEDLPEEEANDIGALNKIPVKASKSFERQPGNEPAFDTPVQTAIIACAECGAEISPRVHDYAIKAFGRPLCMTCQKKVGK